MGSERVKRWKGEKVKKGKGEKVKKGKGKEMKGCWLFFISLFFHIHFSPFHLYIFEITTNSA